MFKAFKTSGPLFLFLTLFSGRFAEDGCLSAFIGGDPRSLCMSTHTGQTLPPARPGPWRREGDPDYPAPITVVHCQCLTSHLITSALLSDND